VALQDELTASLLRALRSEDGAAGPAPLALVMTPDFRILEASEEYRRATLLWGEDIRGAGLFEVFPDNPQVAEANGVGNLRASLQSVLRQHSAHRMSIQRYDVRDARSGAWLERHWLPLNTPVFGSGSREITHIVHQVVNVTQAVLLQRRLSEEPGALVRVASVGRPGQLLPDEARRGPDGRHPGSFVGAGRRAESTGIYRALHHRGCPLAGTRLYVEAGWYLPRCPRCGDAVLYCAALV
jgi:hypothetical protein